MDSISPVYNSAIPPFEPLLSGKSLKVPSNELAEHSPSPMDSILNSSTTPFFQQLEKLSFSEDDIFILMSKIFEDFNMFLKSTPFFIQKFPVNIELLPKCKLYGLYQYCKVNNVTNISHFNQYPDKKSIENLTRGSSRDYNNFLK